MSLAGGNPADGQPVKASEEMTVRFRAGDSLDDALIRLDVPLDRPVLVLVGSASSTRIDDTCDEQVRLMESVLIPVCQDEGAVVVSGGTVAGVMSLLGRTVAELGSQVTLVGVAPHNRLLGHGAHDDDAEAAAREPHHRVIRTDGDTWGSEASTLVRLAERIAPRRGVVVVVLGGGLGTLREIKLAVQRRWPVLLLTGVGGASDDVAAALQLVVHEEGKDTESAELKAVLAYIDSTSSRGLFQFASIADGPRSERLLRWRLSDQALLKEAWLRFSGLDAAASERKDPTARLALSVLALATLTLLFGLAAAFTLRPPSFAGSTDSNTLRTWLKVAATTLPLLAAVVLGVIDRRARDGTFVEHRASAESLLREIYRARTGVGRYAQSEVRLDLLAEALRELDTRTGGRSPLTTLDTLAHPWPVELLLRRIPERDSLLGPINAYRYDEARVQDQLRFLEDRIASTEQRATRLAALTFCAAAGTALFGSLSWRWGYLSSLAALLASVTAAGVAWREYRQRDALSDEMRSTSAALRAARAKWQGRLGDDNRHTELLREYVADVEDALAAENSGWERSLRQAQQVLSDRYKAR